jgi:hypothetical protein
MKIFEPQETPYRSLSSSFAHNPAQSDFLSSELQQKTNKVALVLVSSVLIGTLTLLIGGSKGLEWIGFLSVGVTGLILLSRYFDHALAAFLLICWLNIGSPEVAQGGSGGGSQRLMLSHLGTIAFIAVWVGRSVFQRNFKLFPIPLYLPIALYLLASVWCTVNSLIFPNETIMQISQKQFVQVNIIEILTRVLSLGILIVLGNSLKEKSLRNAMYFVAVPGLIITTPLAALIAKFVPSGWVSFTQIITMSLLAAYTVQPSISLIKRVIACAFGLSIFAHLLLINTEWVSGWMGAGIALAIIAYHRQRRLLYLAIGGMLVFAILNPTLIYEKVYLPNFYSDNGPMSWGKAVGSDGGFDNDRIRMLQAAFKYAYYFPLGIGLGNYRAYNDYFGRTDVWNTTTFSSAHGTYSQALTETGWFGLLSLLAIVYTISRMLLRYYRFIDESKYPLEKTFILGAYAASIGMFCASFIGDYLFPTYHNGGMRTFSICLYTWLVVGVAIAIARNAGLSWEKIQGKPTSSKNVSAIALTNESDTALK